jgi:protein-tyrosine kinase
MSRITDALKRANLGVSPGLPASAARGVEEADFDELFSASDRPVDVARAPAAKASDVPISLQPRVVVRSTEVLERKVPQVVSSAPAATIPVLGDNDVRVQYRKLAASLHNAHVTLGTKVVMVSSAVSGEGKTFTAANLALALSESFRRTVLLIDADLRRPALSRFFQLPDGPGLVDALKTDAELSLVVHTVSPHLSVLSSGSGADDPVAGLSSERMQHIIREAASRYEWVIVDTPPAALVPDASLLAQYVDGSLLVIKAGGAPAAAVENAIAALGRERLLGVVFNHAPRTELSKYGTYDESPYGDAGAVRAATIQK